MTDVGAHGRRTAVEPRFNPFVGPRSIHYGEPIYGRSREIKQLCSTLVAQRIVLLYSPSGAGKTSLIDAGVRPELQHRDFEFLPTIRVGYELADSVRRPIRNRYTLSTLVCLEERLPSSARLNPSELADVTLDDYLRRVIDERGSDVDPCLIFDQFEELFILDAADDDAKAAFVEELGVALRDVGRWALFSMREDFIAQLDPYAALIPQHLSARYRLDLLGRNAAKTAVQQIAADAGVQFLDDAADVLIDDLRRIRVRRGAVTSEDLGPSVEPVQLQVVCRGLWGTLDPEATTIHAQDVVMLGNADDALADFYVHEVRDVAASTGATEREIRTWFDEELISDSGFRAQVLDGPGEHGAAVLRGLVDAHLIRAERRRGAEWYELAHDRLIEPIRANNSAWREGNLSVLQREAQAWDRRGRPAGLLLTGEILSDAQSWAQAHPAELLDVDKDYLESSIAGQRRIELERKVARRRLATATAVTAIALVALLIVGLLLWRTYRAEREAKAQRQEAVRQAQIADQARQEAEAQLIQTRASTMAASSMIEQDPYRALAFALEAELALKPLIPETRSAFAFAVQRLKRAGLAPTILIEGDSGLTAVSWSPDGVHLATASADGSVRVWDASTRQQIGDPLGTNSGGPSTVAWSPDGTHIAIGGSDGTLSIVDSVSHRPVGEPVTTDLGAVASIAWSPDATRIATAGENGAAIWNAVSGELATRILGGPETASPAFLSIAWSPNGTRLAMGGEDGTVWLSDTNTGQPLIVLPGHSAAVRSVAWRPHDRASGDGGGDELVQRLASASDDGTVRIWDGDDLQPVGAPLTGHPEGALSVAWSVDGTELASSGGDGTARIWVPSTASGSDSYVQSGQPLAGHTGPVTSVAWSTAPHELATASDDGTVRVWQPATGVALTGHTGNVYGASWSADGSRLATGGLDQTARIWDAVTGAELDILLQGHGPVTTAAWSPDGTRLAATSIFDQTIRFWDAADLQPIDPPIVVDDLVFPMAWAPRGDRLATGQNDGSVRIWDATNRTQLLSLPGHAGPVFFLAWSPDGTRVAAVSGVVQVWDTTTGQRVGGPLSDITTVATSVAWSPDGAHLAVADGTVQIWDTTTGQAVDDPLIVDAAVITAVAWSPDGSILVTGNSDGSVQLWDVAEHKLLGGPLSGHTDRIFTITWSPDRTRLATASADGTVRLWNSVSEREACEIVSSPDLADEIESTVGSEFVCTKPESIPPLPPLPVVP
jgi:WD40 repeat protein